MTQETDPKYGPPITIPIPTEGQVIEDFRQIVGVERKEGMDREDREGSRVVGEIPEDKPVQQQRKPMPSGYKRALTDEMILKVLNSLGSATMNDLITHLYGPGQDKKQKELLRSRIYHHIVRMRNRGAITQSGTSQGRLYHPAKSVQVEAAPATTESGSGDLFEVVGKIGEVTAVRSLDDHQIYKLEKL